MKKAAAQRKGDNLVEDMTMPLHIPMPLHIQRSIVTALYTTISVYYPLRNKQPAAREYVKQSIEALRFIQKNTAAEDWIAVMM
jgi:hypothetical protein